MNGLRRIVPYVIIVATCLTGCSSTSVGNKVEQVKSTTGTTEKTSKQSGNSADTNITDKYLYNNSYKELAEAEKKGNGLFSSIKLREPLKAKIGEIPETPPDETFVKNTKQDTTNKGETVEDKEKQDKEKQDKEEKNIDNNGRKTELPKPKKFLYELKEYIGNQLLDSGYLIIYSYQGNSTGNNSLVSIDYTLSSLKVGMESLEYKNSTIRELFKDDEKLIGSWDGCYKQLIKAQGILNGITDSNNISKQGKEIDLENLYKSYKEFVAATNNRLVGFEPNVTKE